MRRALERAGIRALQSLDPESAHGLALRFLRLGLGPRANPITSRRLRVSLAGLELPNPVGIAAGFDKNAEVADPLLECGFGFVELGAVTPRPQPGNPKPRVFRLPEDRGAINRLGFNSDGMEVVAARLRNRPARGVVGLNLGANRDSADRAADFCAVLEACGASIEFATVNVSSPNTERLRELQGRRALAEVLGRTLAARDRLPRRIPVFLKVAPDLDSREISEISEVAVDSGVDCIVATNTTISRDGLRGRHRGQSGGLSGQPLFERSTRALAQFAKAVRGKIPLVGVGGVGSAEQAFEKIRAGASAVQLYTALTYEGMTLASRIVSGLDRRLEREGFETVADAVGSGVDDWI